MLGRKFQKNVPNRSLEEDDREGYLAVKSHTAPDGIRELAEIDLYEVSVVPAPMNHDTRFLSVKTFSPAQQEALDQELEMLHRRFKEPVEEKKIDTRPIKVASFEC